MDIFAVIGRPLLIVVIPVALALATRRAAGGDGIGLVELFEVALAPFAAPTRTGHAVPEPDFAPFRIPSDAPATAPAVDAGGAVVSARVGDPGELAPAA